ncbi:hypothetical protein [Mycobacteroides abscessus]|uniref:hypothetical protein n=1 Tax=Mycobacteroides abscessus TaxID=36809 RepID=UPI00210667D1|nr:hypothetical protein [Mycobacteroides abscessus]
MGLRWMRALPRRDRVRCARDLAAATLRGRLRAELRSWRETAAIAAAGLGQDELVWLDDGDEIERP